MVTELEHYCPDCETDRAFYRSASTMLHLGEKTKWYCGECGFGFVRIDGEVDSAAIDSSGV